VVSEAAIDGGGGNVRFDSETARDLTALDCGQGHPFQVFYDAANDPDHWPSVVFIWRPWLYALSRCWKTRYGLAAWYQ